MNVIIKYSDVYGTVTEQVNSNDNFAPTGLYEFILDSHNYILIKYIIK